jgi:enoyl-[acyl-carrier protein] reductase III
VTGKLQGKTALVTGSARGIGRAVAIKLAGEGADVLVNYLTNESAANDVADLVRQAGGRSLVVRADVSRPEELKTLFDAVAREWGGLDIFVNNAIDVAAFGPVRRLRVESWRHTIDSHVTTFLLAAQLALPLMKNRGGGAIVALSSSGSRVCIPDYAAVGVGKAAVEALTRYLAVEFAEYGIRVNAVSGGPIDTDALRALRQFNEIKELSIRSAPAARLGTPDDIAEVVAFLCADGARWVYGQTLIADGGLSLVSNSPRDVQRSAPRTQP